MQRMPPEIDECAEAILDAQRANAETQPALAGELRRMEACHRDWRKRGNTASAQASYEEFWRRCRSLLCAPCLDARTDDNADDILSAHAQAIDEQPSLTTMLITFESPAYPFERASNCADDAIKQWRRFSSRKLFKHAVQGHVRGLKLLTDHTQDTLRAEISTVALFRDDSFIREKGGWLSLWNSASKGAPSQKTVHMRLDLRTREGREELRTFARRVATVAVRPVHLCEEQASGIVCDAWKLKTLKSALRGRRLIQFGGVMSR